MRIRSLISLLLTLILLLISFPCASAETAFISAPKARGYLSADLSGKGVSLKRYTPVEVLERNDTVARISVGGAAGYIALASLYIPGSSDRLACTVVRSGKARSYPDTRKKGVTLRVGTELDVLFYKNGWALAEKDGAVAWVRTNCLALTENFTACQKDAVCVVSSLPLRSAPYSYGKKLTSLHEGDAVTVTGLSEKWARLEISGVVCYCSPDGLKEASQVWTEERIFGSGYENDKMIFLYLTKIMGLNTAAACGVLANIKYESGYRPEAVNKSGTTLGICQWTNGRKSNLIRLCEQYSLPSDSMEGQCRYLRKELEGSYKKTLKYLQGVENSPQGAYDAAYYWCCHFEIPSNKESKGKTRGEYARDTLWSRWN